MSWSTSFVSLKMCVGFSIFDSVSFLLVLGLFFFQQKAWILWLENVTIPFKIKIMEKSYAFLTPDLWFLSCNKKF